MTSAGTTFDIPAELDSIGRIRDLVDERARAAGLDEVAASLYTLACVEAFTNIVRHAGVPPGEATIRLVITKRIDRLQVDFVHTGEHFVPPARVSDLQFGEYPEGGFGLRIMREASDGVEYRQGERANTVRLCKFLPRRG